MAKFCVKCGKPLPDGVEICPDCNIAASESDAALFTRMTAETEIWKEPAEAGKKPRRKKVKKTRSQQQKLMYCAIVGVVAALAVFVVLFTQPVSRVNRAIRSGEYDAAMEIYWGNEKLAAGDHSDSINKTILTAADKICQRFAAHELDADTAATALSKLGTFGAEAEALLSDTYARFREYSSSQDHMSNANKLFLNGEYLAARAEYLLVIEADSDYAVAQTRVEECLAQYTESVLSGANTFIQTNDFAAAILALEEGSDTLSDFGTFSEKIDQKLADCYTLYEKFTLTEAEHLAALEDYQSAAALIRRNMAVFDLSDEDVDAVLAEYLRLGREKEISNTAALADGFYESGEYAAAFETLDSLKIALEAEGDSTGVDDAIKALEERFSADMIAAAKKTFAGARDRLPDAIAGLDAAFAIRALEPVSEFGALLAEYLPVSLVELEYAEKNGTVFRNDSAFESVAGTSYDGWIWGENGADISFRLDGAYDSFECTLAVRRDDNVNANGHFEVWCDGTLAYKSDTLYHYQTEPLGIAVGVTDCTMLKISFVCDYNVSTAENGYCYHGLCQPTLTKDLARLEEAMKDAE